MCRTRIKMISVYADFENIEDIEELVNGFINNPENKVTKVNSVKAEICYDEDDEPFMLVVINYELGD